MDDGEDVDARRVARVEHTVRKSTKQGTANSRPDQHAEIGMASEKRMNCFDGHEKLQAEPGTLSLIPRDCRIEFRRSAIIEDERKPA
jgi:hypothetical protein